MNNKKQQQKKKQQQRKQRQKPAQCRNCHEYHEIEKCPFKFCIFCFSPDFGRHHSCDRSFVKNKLTSIGSYQRYVRNLSVGRDFDAVLAQLKEERNSYNLFSKEWIADFVGGSFDSMDVSTFENIHQLEENISSALWKTPFKVMNVEADIASITIDDIAEYVGAEEKISVFDAHEQKPKPMKMKKFLEIWNSATRAEILNSISMKLPPQNPFFKCPEIFKNVSWQQKISTLPKYMQFKDADFLHYCLLSMAGSFTTFHADFSGTSAYLYCYKGEKNFYLIEPTEENIEVYRRWNRNRYTSPFFQLPELRSSIQKVILREGEMLYLPGGYFHAVFTPQDSITFSGNVLHENNIPTQLQIHAIDVETTNKDDRMEEFELINSFIAYQLFSKDLKTIETIPHADYKCLIPFMQTWLKSKLFKDNEKKKIKKTLENMLIFYHVSQLQ
uniref:JmjC domain-containing protein n=1 Tax=Panagrolaimus sp. ES5 TaxID=591445 RepID=A0AC34FZH9_9BILA